MLHDAPYVAYYDSPVGTFQICADDNGILQVIPTNGLDPYKTVLDKPATVQNTHIMDTITWLDGYFNHKKWDAPLPTISARLTPLQWDLVHIQAGHMPYYGDVKGSTYARAVGTACAKNPIYIMIPCHRVISKSGAFKYGGGSDMKIWLLRFEGALMW